ncbi:uncharacterized protein LOC101708461 [Heterocephalus glaber]|uniref:Uncharacterized protein LOC101708461 n=1 Tax=Heterocephalus glaber TaxID=10181 RepID=A0AAX6R7G3_HETGA|nr:uncharacterized protein LOC101708461 [Heterocephalus glaber]
MPRDFKRTLPQLSAKARVCYRTADATENPRPAHWPASDSLGSQSPPPSQQNSTPALAFKPTQHGAGLRCACAALSARAQSRGCWGGTRGDPARTWGLVPARRCSFCGGVFQGWEGMLLGCVPRPPEPITAVLGHSAQRTGSSFFGRPGAVGGGYPEEKET